MEHPKFRAAYDLLELRAGAENNHELQRLTKWWTEFKIAAPPAQKICSTTSGTILRRAVVTVVRASARRQVAHDSGLYHLGSNLLLHWSRYRRLSAPWAKFRTAAWSPSLPVLPHAAAGPRRISRTISTPPLRWKPPCPPRRCSIILSASNCSRGECAKPNAGGAAQLDLDIMLFGDAVINSERLTVPHYDMKKPRLYALPLFEIAPDLHFPDGLALRAVLDNLGAQSPPAGNPLSFFSICGDRRNRFAQNHCPSECCC